MCGGKKPEQLLFWFEVLGQTGTAWSRGGGRWGDDVRALHELHSLSVDD